MEKVEGQEESGAVIEKGKSMRPIFCPECTSPMRALYDQDIWALYDQDIWECTSLVCDATLTGAEVIQQRNQTRTNDNR